MLAEAAARKSVAEPHHRLNILSPYPQYTLPPLVHLLSFPVDAPLPVRRFFFSPAVEHSVLSRCLSLSLSFSPLTLYLRLISSFSFFFLFFCRCLCLFLFSRCSFSFPPTRSLSPLVASPYPLFLLARLTKMGPAASGSRFPRKLSSYKINYPLYFIALCAVGPGPWRGVDVSRTVSFLFLCFLFSRVCGIADEF